MASTRTAAEPTTATYRATSTQSSPSRRRQRAGAHRARRHRRAPRETEVRRRPRPCRAGPGARGRGRGRPPHIRAAGGMATEDTRRGHRTVAHDVRLGQSRQGKVRAPRGSTVGVRSVPHRGHRPRCTTAVAGRADIPRRGALPPIRRRQRATGGACVVFRARPRRPARRRRAGRIRRRTHRADPPPTTYRASPVNRFRPRRAPTATFTQQHASSRRAVHRQQRPSPPPSARSGKSVGVIVS
jgi:hypothetical protein